MQSKPTFPALNARQRRFVEEYLLDLNATQAAIRSGYSKKTAYCMGHENLKKPEIAAAIQAEIDAQSKRTQVTRDMVIREMSRLAFSNIRKFAKWNDDGVKLTDSEELNEDETACVSEVSQSKFSGGSEDRPWERTEVKFKLHSKDRALDMLGKHFGIFDEKRFDHEKELIRLKKEEMEAAAASVPMLVFDEDDGSGGGGAGSKAPQAPKGSKKVIN